MKYKTSIGLILIISINLTEVSASELQTVTLTIPEKIGEYTTINHVWKLHGCYFSREGCWRSWNAEASEGFEEIQVKKPYQIRSLTEMFLYLSPNSVPHPASFSEFPGMGVISIPYYFPVMTQQTQILPSVYSGSFTENTALSELPGTLSQMVDTNNSFSSEASSQVSAASSGVSFVSPYASSQSVKISMNQNTQTEALSSHSSSSDQLIPANPTSSLHISAASAFSSPELYKPTARYLIPALEDVEESDSVLEEEKSAITESPTELSAQKDNELAELRMQIEALTAEKERAERKKTDVMEQNKKLIAANKALEAKIVRQREKITELQNALQVGGKKQIKISEQRKKKLKNK